VNVHAEPWCGSEDRSRRERPVEGTLEGCSLSWGVVTDALGSEKGDRKAHVTEKMSGPLKAKTWGSAAQFPLEEREVINRPIVAGNQRKNSAHPGGGKVQLFGKSLASAVYDRQALN